MTKPKVNPTVTTAPEKKEDVPWWFPYAMGLIASLAFIGIFPTMRWVVGTAKHIHAVWSAPARVEEVRSEIKEHRSDQWSGDHRQDGRLDGLELRVKALEGAAVATNKSTNLYWWDNGYGIVTNINTMHYSTNGGDLEWRNEP